MQTSVHYKSPLGVLRITGDETAVHEVLFVGNVKRTISKIKSVPPKPITQAINFLDQYFQKVKNTKKAPLPSLIQQGTPFQLTVWKSLTVIPRGTTVSYQALARLVGKPRAVRAVANAVGANAILLLVPCHRVIRTDGSLGGFASGSKIKKALLTHEHIYFTK